MKESTIEKRLREAIEKRGGKAFKFTSPGNIGVPDRIVLLAGQVRFVELKKPGLELRAIQKYRKRQFEKLGFQVAVIDSIEKVEEFLNELKDSAKD